MKIFTHEESVLQVVQMHIMIVQLGRKMLQNEDKVNNEGWRETSEAL